MAALRVWILVFVSSALLSTAAWSFDQIRAVSLNGNQILFDGKETAPKGVIIQAFQFPDKGLKTCVSTSEFCDRQIEGQDFFYARGKF